jgi:hypothetical protein
MFACIYSVKDLCLLLFLDAHCFRQDPRVWGLAAQTVDGKWRVRTSGFTPRALPLIIIRGRPWRLNPRTVPTVYSKRHFVMWSLLLRFAGLCIQLHQIASGLPQVHVVLSVYRGRRSIDPTFGSWLHVVSLSHTYQVARSPPDTYWPMPTLPQFKSGFIRASFVTDMWSSSLISGARGPHVGFIFICLF